jgi:rod shape-determining protein MreD
MTHITIWLLLAAAVVVQTTLVPFAQVGNARPDLLLAVSVSMGLIFGRVAGASVGFFGGLLWDLLTAQIFGMNTLAKLITGYTAGGFEKQVFKENPIVPILALFLATFVHELILYMSAVAFEIKVPFWALVGHTILPHALYNSMIAPFVYFGIYKIKNSIWTEERLEKNF